MKTYYIYQDNKKIGPFQSTGKLKKMKLSLDTLIYDDKSREWESLENHQDRHLIAFEFPKNFLLLKKETILEFQKKIKKDSIVFCILPALLLSILSFYLSPSVDSIINTRIEFLYADYQNYISRPLYSIFSTIYIYESEYQSPSTLFLNLFIASLILIGVPFILSKIYALYKLKKENNELYKGKILNWLDKNHEAVIEESLIIDYNGTSIQFSEIKDSKLHRNLAYIAFEKDGTLNVKTTQ